MPLDPRESHLHHPFLTVRRRVLLTAPVDQPKRIAIALRETLLGHPQSPQFYPEILGAQWLTAAQLAPSEIIEMQRAGACVSFRQGHGALGQPLRGRVGCL